MSVNKSTKGRCDVWNMPFLKENICRRIIASVLVSASLLMTFGLYDLLRSYSSTRDLNTENITYSTHPWSKLMLAEKKMLCFPNDLITVQSGGRLGNQIMEYASVWSLAWFFGLKPFVPDDIMKALENVFEELSVPSFNEFVQKNTFCSVRGSEIHIENLIGQTEDVNRMVDSLESTVMNARSTRRIILVDRYNVMGETIGPLIGKLHEEFHYKPALVDGAQRSLAVFRYRLMRSRNISCAEQVIFVGIHVRRTDYGENIDVKYNATGPVGVDYYRRAIYWMRKSLLHDTAPTPLNIAFVVVSDDPCWCKTVLIPSLTGVKKNPGIKKQNRTLGDCMGKYNVFWGGQGDVTTPEQDLVLLSSCNHSIVSYGSFGLWSALMAGGKTVVYDTTANGQEECNPRKSPSMVFAEHLHYWAILS